MIAHDDRQLDIVWQERWHGAGNVRVTIVALLLAAASLVACGDSNATPTATEPGARAEPVAVPAMEIRPIADILVGEIRVTQLQSASAAVEVETAVDVVCSIVFGTGTDYGAQSTAPSNLRARMARTRRLPAVPLI